MNPTVYVIIAILLISVQIGYLRLARHFGIVDQPNERSSHTNLTTVRGGGVLFFVAALAAFVFSGFAYPYFFAGLTLVATVSFLDDLRPLPGRYRLLAQFVGVALLLHETGLLTNEMWVVAGSLIVGIGILNANNFMDGINAMTAWYSLVCVGTLWSWQRELQVSTADSFLPFTFIGLLIFSYANARRRAVCFAGDVGSVSIGFVILLPLIQIILSTRTYLPILLLAVYGVDSGLTLLHRLYHRQNIFQAHRQHLFQLLVHKRNWPHLRVSALYALIQLIINGLVINAVDWPVQSQWMFAGGVLAALSMLYIVVRRRLV
ncbi:MraY family glycosyltransferase [Spirosoma arcticum]